MLDMAAMREAVAALGGDPARVDPVLPVDLVIDHSVRVDHFGSPDALAQNQAIELARDFLEGLCGAALEPVSRLIEAVGIGGLLGRLEIVGGVGRFHVLPARIGPSLIEVERGIEQELP